MVGKSLCSQHTRHNARSGVLALILLAAFAQGSARAEDDDDKNSIWNLDKRLLDAFAKGLGLVRGDDPQVDYRERSPLIVPPNRNLPPPNRCQSAPPNGPSIPTSSAARIRPPGRSLNATAMMRITRTGRSCRARSVLPVAAKLQVSLAKPARTRSTSRAAKRPIWRHHNLAISGVFSAGQASGSVKRRSTARSRRNLRGEV